ncbi:MAG: type II toxin-antitoxin system ParD family antitoxin [Magnetococcales bacterium]|nr:type II toxin-antitoxin system ParD family antitoxin [Magnetococcales bacterium]
MSTNISLTQELENLARSCMESGHYNNVNEVIRGAPNLLQDQEARREKFTAMLRTTQEDADREGVYTIDQVLSEMDEIIDNASR